MKITSRSLGLAAILFATTAVTQAQDIAAGDVALVRFDLDSALAAYRAAHQQSPDNFEATWKLARALIDKGTLTKNRAEQKPLYVEAELLSRSAVKLKPDDAIVHAYLAVAVGKRALFEGGKRKVELSQEVKAEAEKALSLDPKQDLACHVLGVWNREMVELNWILRTFAELFYGKLPSASLDDALSNLRQAVELAPNVVPHQVELGITLASARKWPEAKMTLDRALAMPKAWVTDNYYKEQAKRVLERVNARIR